MRERILHSYEKRCKAKNVGDHKIWIELPGLAAVATQLKAKPRFKEQWIFSVPDRLEFRKGTVYSSRAGTLGKKYLAYALFGLAILVLFVGGQVLKGWLEELGNR